MLTNTVSVRASYATLLPYTKFTPAELWALLNFFDGNRSYDADGTDIKDVEVGWFLYTAEEMRKYFKVGKDETIEHFLKYHVFSGYVCVPSEKKYLMFGI